MHPYHVSDICAGQDGAVFGDYLFRFNAKGLCRVYDVSEIKTPRLLSEFTLDMAEEIVPHSNAVVFGREYFRDGDEFPLLYSNIYNNYAKREDPLTGVCCVYRLQREGDRFTSSLVQLIEIGFTSERGLWRSEGDVADVRPYGNFVIDRENGIYYAFVMRDGDRTTRYFAFDLPRLADGETDSRYGVRRAVLHPDDIKRSFDVPYHQYIQGACLYRGLIYSVEGFHERIHPALRVIDPTEGKEIYFFDFCDAGMPEEAEMIDFHRDVCYYGNCKGNIYRLDLPIHR